MKIHLVALLFSVSSNLCAMEIVQKMDTPNPHIINEILNAVIYNEYQKTHPETLLPRNAVNVLVGNVPEDVVHEIAECSDDSKKYMPTRAGWVSLSRAYEYKLYNQWFVPGTNIFAYKHIAIILSDNLNNMRPVKLAIYPNACADDELLAKEHGDCRPDVQCFVNPRTSRVLHDNDYGQVSSKTVVHDLAKRKGTNYYYDGLNIYNNGLFIINYPNNRCTFTLLHLDDPIVFEKHGKQTTQTVFEESALLRGKVTAHALDYGSNSMMVCTKVRNKKYPYHVYIQQRGLSAPTSAHKNFIEFVQQHAPTARVELVKEWRSPIPSHSRIKKCSLFSPSTGIGLSRQGTLYVFGIVNGGIESWRQKITYADGARMNIEQYAMNGARPTQLLLLDSRRTLYYADIKQAQELSSSSCRIALHKITQLSQKFRSIERLWYFGNRFSYIVSEANNSNDNWCIHMFDVVPYSAPIVQHMASVLYAR